RAAFRNEDVLHNRNETLSPLSKCACIPLIKAGEGVTGFFKVSPPLQRFTVPKQQGHVEFWFQVTSSVSFELEVSKPRHLSDCTMVEGMCVMEEPWMTRVFVGS